MKILVVYYLVRRTDRNTIDEHLYSFARYSGQECWYLNAFFGVPSFITRIPFDLIVYHYTFTGLKWNGAEHFEADLRRLAALKGLPGYKVAVPQDEYVNTVAMCRFFRDFGIRTVFTCFPPSEYQKAYPRELSGLEHYVTVLTGYIDETSLAEVSAFCRPHRERTRDVGYRARKVPFWLGRHGLIKWRLTEVFQEAAAGTGIRADLSNDDRDVFIGKEWYRFLADCRVVLGCEGGASLHDPVGEIRGKVEDYVAAHPDASFDEVERTCFKGLDGNLELFALSPRHFEACITRTCQALVEGEYAGIFKPGVHYIEIRKDWSNVDEVVEKIRDADYCQNMAERAYEDIIRPGRCTYRAFVREVLEHVRDVCPEVSAQASRKTSPPEHAYLLLLRLREAAPFLFSPLYFLLNVLYKTRLYTASRTALFSGLERCGLVEDYKEMRRRNLGITLTFAVKLARAALGRPGTDGEKRDGR